MAELGSPVTGPNPRPAGPAKTVIAVDPREAEEHRGRQPEAGGRAALYGQGGIARFVRASTSQMTRFEAELLAIDLFLPRTRTIN